MIFRTHHITLFILRTFFVIFDLISILFHYYHTHKQMVDVAVEEGGISGGTNGGKGYWGEVLGLAKEVGSGAVAVSLY